jgi:hypothetical protein
MDSNRTDRTVVTQGPVTSAGQETTRTDSHRVTRTGPEGEEVAKRIIVLVAGLIQIVIGARIVLRLLDANIGNGIVAGVMNVSNVFVAPFNGILHTNSLSSSGAVLDIAAVLALVGWTVVELVIFWAMDIFRKDTTTA